MHTRPREYLTRIQRRDLILGRDWTRYFAWRPRRLKFDFEGHTFTTWVWLEWIERKAKDHQWGAFDRIIYTWVYRLKPPK